MFAHNEHQTCSNRLLGGATVLIGCRATSVPFSEPPEQLTLPEHFAEFFHFNGLFKEIVTILLKLYKILSNDRYLITRESMQT